MGKTKRYEPQEEYEVPSAYSMADAIKYAESLLQIPDLGELNNYGLSGDIMLLDVFETCRWRNNSPDLTEVLRSHLWRCVNSAEAGGGRVAASGDGDGDDWGISRVQVEHPTVGTVEMSLPTRQITAMGVALTPHHPLRRARGISLRTLRSRVKSFLGLARPEILAGWAWVTAWGRRRSPEWVEAHLEAFDGLVDGLRALALDDVPMPAVRGMCVQRLGVLRACDLWPKGHRGHPVGNVMAFVERGLSEVLWQRQRALELLALQERQAALEHFSLAPRQLPAPAGRLVPVTQSPDTLRRFRGLMFDGEGPPLQHRLDV